MYASIKANNFIEFHVRVFAKPVEENKDYRVYEIAGDPENSGITIRNKKRGTKTDGLMYLAITCDKILHIYNDGNFLLKIGECCFEKDEYSLKFRTE